MKHLIGLLLFFNVLISTAQESITATFQGSYNVYPVDTLGVVLLNRNMVQLSTGDLALEYIGLDTSLEEKWKNMFPFTKGMSPVFQEVSAEGILLLFSSKSGKEYELIKASADYGDYERFQYSFSDRVQVLELEVYYDNVWIAGLIGNNPAIFKLKPDNTFETVPTGVPGDVKYAGRIAFNRESKGFNFLILANIQKTEKVIWRSIDLNGKVLQNQVLSSEPKKSLRTIKATYTSNQAYLTGTYGIGARERLTGVFFGVVNADQKQLIFREFKSIQGVVSYKKVEDIERFGFRGAKSNKFKMSNMSVFVDGLDVDAEGYFSVALEVYKPEFRSRGALEKEFIARDRTAQIDQNVYGRQGAVGTTLDLEGRMDRASATDQIQMRFMDQSLSKAVNQGVSYNHTAYLMVSPELLLEDSKGVAFDLMDFGSLTRVSNFKEGRLNYPFGKRYQSFDLTNGSFKSIEVPESTSLINWTSENILAISYNKEAKTLTLSIKRLD